MIGGYSSTVGTGRVTPNNHSYIGGPHNYINAQLLTSVLSSLGSNGGMGAANLQRELYNLL